MSYSSINMQEAISPNMENLTFLHDYSMTVILIIMMMIIYLYMTLLINKFNNKFILENQLIEIIWTVIPMITLMFVAIPSLKTLYLTDEIYSPSLTIKSIAHQWYWSYEYSDFMNIEFNSFINPFNKSSNINSFRLLDVDNHVIIPFKTYIRLLSTSSDVIHSWTLPSMGVKIDSVPGRINQMLIYSNRPGLFFGQCSEICGMNHSFMPIVVESTSPKYFINWLKSI